MRSASRALPRKLPWRSREIVINDTGSTDATIEIARSHGARVIVSNGKMIFRIHATFHCAAPPALGFSGLTPTTSSLYSLSRLINDLKKSGPTRCLALSCGTRNREIRGRSCAPGKDVSNDPRICFERRIHEQMMLSALRIASNSSNTGSRRAPWVCRPRSVDQESAAKHRAIIRRVQAKCADPVMRWKSRIRILSRETTSKPCNGIGPYLKFRTVKRHSRISRRKLNLGWGNILNKANDLRTPPKIHKPLRFRRTRRRAL